MVSVYVKQQWRKGAPELRSCVNVEVDVLGSLSLIAGTVSVDLRSNIQLNRLTLRADEVSESLP